MNRYVFIKLRLANKDDFFDQWNQIKTGTMYFEQSASGAMQKQPRYFTKETNKEVFRELYTHNQIFVAVNPNEVEIVEEKEETQQNFY